MTFSLTNTFSTIKSITYNLEQFVHRSGRPTDSDDEEHKERKSPTPFLPIDAYDDKEHFHDYK
jgi:hypothetical protein